MFRFLTGPLMEEAGAGGGGGGVPAISMSAAIDAALAPIAPAAPAAAPSGIENAPIPVAPGAVAPITPSVPALATPTALDLLEDITPEAIPQTTNAQGQSVGARHTYTEAQSRKLQTAHKLLRQLTEIVPDLNVDSFREIVGRSQAGRSMMDMFRQGINPTDQTAAMEAIDSILTEVFAKESPEAFGLLAIRAAAMLSKVNPQAWAVMVNWHRKNLQGDPAMLEWHKKKLVQEAKDEIPLYQDAAARKQQVYFVMNLEQRLLGADSVTPEDVLMRHVPTTPNVNPLAAERADLERRTREQDEREQRAAQRADAERVNLLNTAEQAAIGDEINTFLAPYVASSTPQELEFLRGTLRQEIMTAEDAHTADWSPAWQSHYAQARRSGSAADIKVLTDYRRTIAKRVLLSNGKQITDPWVQRQVDRNTAARQNAANPHSNEPAPNGPGTPARPEGIDELLKNPNWKDTFALAGLG